MVQNRVKLVINDAKSTFQGDQRGSFGERMNMWSKSSKIFLKHPLLGVGTGGLKEALEKYRLENPKFPSYAQPHNGYLYLASCFGIIGLVSFFWLLAIFLKKGWQSRHNLAGFCVFSYGLVFFIGNLTDTQILSLATAKMFALLTGLKVEAEDAERG